MNDFTVRHNIEAVPADVQRIKRQLAAFFADVESIDEPGSHYVQMYHGEAVRDAIAKRDSLRGAFGASIAMRELPDHWPTKYRASVCFHLAPLLYELVNS